MDFFEMPFGHPQEVAVATEYSHPLPALRVQHKAVVTTEATPEGTPIVYVAVNGSYTMGLSATVLGVYRTREQAMAALKREWLLSETGLSLDDEGEMDSQEVEALEARLAGMELPWRACDGEEWFNVVTAEVE